MQDDAVQKRSLSSFKKVQEMLCLCQIEEITGEEEFVLLAPK